MTKMNRGIGASSADVLLVYLGKDAAEEEDKNLVLPVHRCVFQPLPMEMSFVSIRKNKI